MESQIVEEKKEEEVKEMPEDKKKEKKEENVKTKEQEKPKGPLITYVQCYVHLRLILHYSKLFYTLISITLYSISLSLVLSTSLNVYLILTLANHLLYPPHAFGMEVTIFCCLIIMQWIRLFLGNMGNRAASSGAMLWVIITSVGVGFGQFVFMTLQTFV